MLTISAKGIYGLTALLELGLHYQKGTMQIKDIAEAHKIPQHYLEQLLVMMKKAGIVVSFRGAQGGYALADHPGNIKALDALACLEGKLEIVAQQHRQGALGFFWDKLEVNLADQLNVTLEELILAGKEFDRSHIYHI